MTDWQVPQSWSGQITLAAERIKGRIRPTPVTELSPGIFLKREDLQRTGSFKDRGVWNSILETQPGAGHIATTSSGNTAIACAWATAQLGLDLTVYLPIPSRLGAAELSGPRVRIVDMSATTFSNASRIAEREASENGALYISPGSGVAFAEGNGTLGLEILEQLPEIRSVVVPSAGGGLLVGLGATLKAKAPGVKVLAAQLTESPYLRALMDRSPLGKVVERKSTIEILTGDLEDRALVLNTIHDICDDVILVPTSRALTRRVQDGSLLAALDPAVAIGVIAAEQLPADYRPVCVVATGIAR